MDRDPGLTPQPWLAIETQGERVFVDGSEVEGPGTVADKYAAATARVADEVAAPLGRRVGATVTDADGTSRHVAIHPDGTVEDLDELVSAAAAPLPAAASAVPASMGGAGRATGTEWPGRGSKRPLVAGAAVALVALLSGAVAMSNVWGESGEPPARSGTRLAADQSSSASPSTEPAATTPVRSLAARVRSTGPCQVLVVADTSPRGARVTVVFHSTDGSQVVHRVRAEDGRARLVVEALFPGRTTWEVRTEGTEPVRGVVRVMPPPA